MMDNLTVDLLMAVGALVGGLPILADCYLKRPNPSSGTDWLRDAFDTKRWSWWVPVLWIIGMVMVAAGGFARGRWSALFALPPMIAMGVIAVRQLRAMRRSGDPTRLQ